MNEFVKMDVFFVVATLAVIVVAVLLALILYRVVKILRHVEHVTQIVSEEGDLIRADVADLRGAIKREGFKFSTLAGFARRRAESFMRPRGKSRKPQEDSSE